MPSIRGLGVRKGEVYQFTSEEFAKRAELIVASADAYYEFHNMLWWGRSLMQRLDGTWNAQPTGLIKFLPSGASRRVRHLRNSLRAGAFAEVKDLADYSLHAFVLPSDKVRYGDEDIVLPLPDRVPGKLSVGQAFTYDEGRHVAGYARQLWVGVSAFIDGVFEVLEGAQRDREDAVAADRLRLMQSLGEDLLPGAGTFGPPIPKAFLKGKGMTGVAGPWGVQELSPSAALGGQPLLAHAHSHSAPAAGPPPPRGAENLSLRKCCGGGASQTWALSIRGTLCGAAGGQPSRLAMTIPSLPPG